MTVADRILGKLGDRSEDECWTWTGCTQHGYGLVWVDGVRRSARVHRVVYELLVGPIPEGLTLDHLCRNRACCNPAHLEPVTLSENVKRGGNSLKTHCPNGHDYSLHGFVITSRNGSTERACRPCRRVRDLAYYHQRARDDPEYLASMAARRRARRASAA